MATTPAQTPTSVTASTSTSSVASSSTPTSTGSVSATTPAAAIDVAQMNTFRSYVTMLGDPTAKDEIKMKAAQELNENWELITQCGNFQSFLEHSMKIFIKILQEGDPLFISEYNLQQVGDLWLLFFFFCAFNYYYYSKKMESKPFSDLPMTELICNIFFCFLLKRISGAKIDLRNDSSCARH